MTFTRRGFVTGAGLGLATLLARKHLVAYGAPDARRKGAVVVIVQRGAVDGLAMVPPHGDPLLAQLRPTLAKTATIDLDGYWGLHEKLAPLAAHFTAKRLAIVPAVGLPGASRSHFEAQDLLEQGGIVAPTGWANRMLARDAQPSDTTAIAVGTTLPRSLAGRAPALVIEGNGQIGIARPIKQRAIREQLVAAFGELYAAHDDPFSATARRALASASRIEQALAAVPARTTPKGPVAQAAVTAARLLRADLGAELIVVDTGGWDTHTAQAPRLERNFALLGEAIDTFVTELGDKLADVTLVTVSEFGRTVKENGTGGTDHGTGTTSLVLGGAVAGGRIAGTFPGLREDQRFEGRDVAIATDVRDLLAEVLATTLGLSAETLATVFPDHARRPVGLFTT